MYCCNSNRPTNYIVVSQSDESFIDFDLVLDQLKLTDCDDEAYVQMLVNAAISFYELYTKRDIVSRTYRCFLDYFYSTGIYTVRRTPLTAITSIQYYADGVLTAIDPSEYYLTQSSEFRSIAPVNQWPTNGDVRLQSVEIEFTSGYDSFEDVPQNVTAGILAHVSNMYANRGDCSSASCQALLPPTSKLSYSQQRINDLRIC